MLRLRLLVAAFVLALIGALLVLPASAAVETLFGTTVPPTKADSDAQAVTVGLKFTPRTAGRVTGIRFYKGTGNTGTHVVGLYASSGAKVAEARTTTTATGWVNVSFTGVAVSAGATYTAAVLDPRGHYPIQQRYPWPKQGTNLTGVAGVYRYGSTLGFPSSTYNASNYFVDVNFSASAPTPSPSPSVTPSASPSVTPTTASPTPSPSPTPNPGGLSVRVAGNRLVDGAGSAVVLRGVNVSGTEFSCIQGGDASSRGWSIYGGQPLTDGSTYAGIASWRANVVRVPLNEDCWLGINGVNPSYGGAAYRQAIHDEVSAIHAAGLFAVLDLHWSAPGAYAAASQQPMADADHAIDFWKSVAGDFRADPAVVFDLYNEPYFYWISDGSDQWSCWLNGCQMNQFVTANQPGPNGESTGYTTAKSWRTAGMQQLVDAVRSTGATQPIIVNGVDWANDLSGWWSHRPTDPAGQLIAGWHSYMGQPCGTSSCWNGVIAPLAGNVPVLVGETGDHATSAATYLPNFLPWADAHGINYLAWTWNVWGDADNVLIRAWDGSVPTTGEGTYYRDHLRSLG